MIDSLHPRLIDAPLRMARHYAALVCSLNTDYGRGFEVSLEAVRRFKLERTQFEKSVAWLMAHLEDDEAAKVFVDFLANSYQLLYARFDLREFQIWLEEGLKAARRLRNRSAEAGIDIAMGYIVQSAGAYQQSLEWFEQASTIAQEIGNYSILASSLHAQASCLRFTGQPDRASAVLEQVYQLHREMGKLHKTGGYLFERGNAFFNAGDFDQAIDLLDQAYQLALQTGEYRETARALATIGLIYHTKGQYHEAISIYQQALEFAEVIDFPPVLVYVLHTTADSYAAVKNVDVALTYYLRALRIAERHALAKSAADIQMELGVLARKQGNYSEAETYLEAVLQYLSASDSRYSVAMTLCELSLVYAARGEDARAHATVREGLEIMAAMDNVLWMLNPISAAIEVITTLATRPHISRLDATDHLEAAATWAGFLLAHPGVDQGKIEVIAALRPQIEQALTPERTAQLFEQGVALSLSAVTEAILAYL